MADIDWNVVLSCVPAKDKARVRDVLEKDYLDVLECGSHPVVENDGVLRFKLNRLVNLFYEWNAPGGDRTRERLDVNRLHILYQSGAFSREEFMQYYRDIGISLCGFVEVFLQTYSEETADA